MEKNLMKSSKSILASILAVVMFATACSTSWVTEAIAITNAILPVAVNIIQLVTALQGTATASDDATLAQKWANTVTADLTALQALLNQYSAADAASKPGMLGRIETAIQVTQSDLGTLLPTLHIANPQTMAKITGIVGLVSAELQSIEALVQAVRGPKTSAWHNLSFQRPMSAKEFNVAYKMLIKSPSGYAPLDAATGALVLP